jgi:DNA-binding NarL/FixJ family response regulator
VTIKVLIADDQEMVRAGFRMILDGQDDMTVVAEVGDGTSALAEARRLQPDVCLLDIRMPGLDGLQVTRELTAQSTPAPPRVVIVTTFDHDEYVHTALHYGAVGFLLKNSGPALLVEAVRAAYHGESLIAPAVTVRLLRHLAGRHTAVLKLSEPLTEREEQLVLLLARGATNQELADGLHVALSTVKTHLMNIQNKLGARNRVEIAAWAWESGLLSS